MDFQVKHTQSDTKVSSNFLSWIKSAIRSVITLLLNPFLTIRLFLFYSVLFFRYPDVTEQGGNCLKSLCRFL